MEHEEDSLIMTNEEIKVDSAGGDDDYEGDKLESKEENASAGGDEDYEGDSEDEDTTYEEEKEITKGKTLFDFEK
jgi:hypothetical protein